MRTRMYGGVRGRKTKVGGKSTFVFLLLDCNVLCISAIYVILVFLIPSNLQGLVPKKVTKKVTDF